MGVATRIQASARGAAYRCRYVEIRKRHSLVRKSLEIGKMNGGIRILARLFPVKEHTLAINIIGINQNEIGAVGGGCFECRGFGFGFGF